MTCGRSAIGTECDKCGDFSNSDPDLMCGRVEYDEDTSKALTQPCSGTYRIITA